MAFTNMGLSFVFGLQEGKELTKVLADAFMDGEENGRSSNRLGGITLWRVFFITSDFRLMELLNPTHPL